MKRMLTASSGRAVPTCALMTPMAANFNLVPAALLELKDQNAVIKAQIGTAVPLLVVNILFIYFFAFR